MQWPDDVKYYILLLSHGVLQYYISGPISFLIYFRYL